MLPKEVAPIRLIFASAASSSRIRLLLAEVVKLTFSKVRSTGALIVSIGELAPLTLATEPFFVKVRPAMFAVRVALPPDKTFPFI